MPTIQNSRLSTETWGTFVFIEFNFDFHHDLQTEKDTSEPTPAHSWQHSHGNSHHPGEEESH